MFYSRYSDDKGSAGFTLIELLNVIVIIGIVSAVGIPKFSQYKNKAYDVHAKRALKDMHLLCNAFWIDTYPAQECDLPTIKDTYYGFNQNSNILATLPPAPSDTFCATAKHDSSPNVFSINNASLISSGEKCGVSIVNASFPPRPAFICSGTFQDPCPKMGCDEECTKQKAQDRLLAVINELPDLMKPSSDEIDNSIQEIQSRTYSDDSEGTPTMTANSSVNELLASTMEPPFTYNSLITQLIRSLWSKSLLFLANNLTDIMLSFFKKIYIPLSGYLAIKESFDSGIPKLSISSENFEPIFAPSTNFPLNSGRTSSSSIVLFWVRA